MIGKKGKERGVGERGEGLSSLSPPSCFSPSPSPSSFCACHASLPADVLWGLFVTHSFLPNGEMNAWQTKPKGRLRGGYWSTATQATKGFPTSSLFKIKSALRERPEGRLTFVLSHFTLLHNKLINFNPMRTLSHFLLVDIKLSHDMTEINNNVQDNTQV